MTAKKFLKGFTLIELLIVIAILGILAAAVLVAVNPAKRSAQARDAGRKNDIGSVATALQAYFTTPGQGQYPAAGGCPLSASALTLLTITDLKQLPTDSKGPNAPFRYCYEVAPSTTDAAVWSTLEAPSTSTGIWCWRSSTGTATEVVASTNCTAP